MIKKYVIAAIVVLSIFLFISTSTASYIVSNGNLYDNLLDNSFFSKLLENIPYVLTNNYDNDIMNMDEDNDYIEITDQSTPEENVLLPDIINADCNNEIQTIDTNIEDGAIKTIVTIIDDDTELTDELTVESDGNEGTTTCSRLIDIIMEENGKIGTILQRVIERTFAPGTTESDTTSENIVNDVVVTELDGITLENNNSNVVVISE